MVRLRHPDGGAEIATEHNKAKTKKRKKCILQQANGSDKISFTL